jgi:hypothetical protein
MAALSQQFPLRIALYIFSPTNSLGNSYRFDENLTDKNRPFLQLASRSYHFPNSNCRSDDSLMDSYQPCAKLEMYLTMKAYNNYHSDDSRSDRSRF